MVGERVAQEEPMVDDPTIPQLVDNRADGVGQDAVSGCGTGVDPEVEPFGTQGKGASQLGCAPGLGCWCGLPGADEGHDDLVGEAALRPGGDPGVQDLFDNRSGAPAQHLGGGGGEGGAGGVAV